MERHSSDEQIPEYHLCGGTAWNRTSNHYATMKQVSIFSKKLLRIYFDIISWPSFLLNLFNGFIHLSDCQLTTVYWLSDK